MERDSKSKSYIVKEAETVINNYIKKKKEKFSNLEYKEKYERLKILSIVMGIVYSLGALFMVIFK